MGWCWGLDGAGAICPASREGKVVDARQAGVKGSEVSDEVLAALNPAQRAKFLQVAEGTDRAYTLAEPRRGNSKRHPR